MTVQIAIILDPDIWLPARREKAEIKRVQLQERIAAGEQIRERVPTIAVPDDEDVEWQQLVAANHDAGCAACRP